MTAEKSVALKAAVSNFQKLVEDQRKVNDEQIRIRRATWDQYLDTVTEPGEVQNLLKQLASDAAAW